MTHRCAYRASEQRCSYYTCSRDNLSQHKAVAHKKKQAGKKVLILGIGNILMTDEGLGVRAVEAVTRGYTLPPGAECLDGGTMGLALLEFINAFPHIIIVDAVSSGLRPGSILRIRGAKLPAAARGATPATLHSSAHGLGVKELIALAGFEGSRPLVTVIGMEPMDISPGLKLTPLIKKRLPELVAAVIDELKKTGVTAAQRRAHA